MEALHGGFLVPIEVETFGEDEAIDFSFDVKVWDTLF